MRQLPLSIEAKLKAGRSSVRVPTPYKPSYVRLEPTAVAVRFERTPEIGVAAGTSWGDVVRETGLSLASTLVSPVIQTSY